MDFLPKDYTPPSSGNYTRLEQGETKIRILSSAIIGFEYFNTENKPVRSKKRFESTPNIKEGGKQKEFWAFVVYNYTTKKVEVCEITQANIKNAILALVKDEDYGDPKGYDIKINRSGSGLDTEYTILPGPVKNCDATFEYDAKKINLEALYTGGNPFIGGSVEDDLTLSEEF